jgi:hypothetical protein
VTASLFLAIASSSTLTWLAIVALYSRNPERRARAMEVLDRILSRRS